MFENLGKAVIVTGSQVPLVQLRTDAFENFTGALILAGQYGDQITEVGLFFDSTLFRGNRVTKVNASGFGAYDSPNYLPLAKIGVDIEGKWLRHLLILLIVLSRSSGISPELLQQFSTIIHYYT